MSVIHDALKKGVRGTPVPRYPVLLPDDGSRPAHLMRAPLFQTFARSGRRRFPAFVISGLWLTLFILFFGGALWIASRHKDVPARDSSPKPRTAAVSAPRLRPDVHPAKNRLFGTPAFSLSGVVEGPEPIAVINDRAVGVGDRIEQALVKEIQGRRVILEFKGAEIVLSLQEV